MPLDLDRCDLDAADWQRGTGRIRLEGRLTLNFVKVRCQADVDLASLSGHGRLEVLAGDDPTA